MKTPTHRTRAHLSIHRGQERREGRQIPHCFDRRNKVQVYRQVMRARVLEGRYDRVPVARWSRVDRRLWEG